MPHVLVIQELGNVPVMYLYRNWPGFVFYELVDNYSK
jgi:hypothetical protein